MKNRVSFKRHTFLVALCAAVSLASCSDWTDMQSIDIDHPSVGTTAPEVYAKYLAALNAYKSSDHQIVYGWFDNSAKTTIASRSQLICDLPDSVDCVSLLYPDNLTSAELKDIETVRAKGTRVVFDVDYSQIVKGFEPVEAEDAEADFTAYMEREVDKQLLLADKYPYDGVTIVYENRDLSYVPDEEKEAFEATQRAFFDKFAKWKQANPSKMLCFYGSAQTLIDKAILADCRYIILNTLAKTNRQGLTYAALETLREGVPADRFIAVVRPLSTDANDLKTGYFIADDGSSVSAITEAANWVLTPNANFSPAGVGIYGINNDYYNSAMVYAYTRKAIATMNPSR